MGHRSLRSLLLLVAAVAGLATSGCAAKKKAVFSPEQSAPPAAAALPAPDAVQPQPLGAEGFAETPLAGASGDQANQLQRPGALAVDAVETALKPIYFAYDSDALDEDALAALAANAGWLRQHGLVKVQIEGHCDERGTVEYNLALGQRRARAVRDHLVRLGVAVDRLDLISYGEERPAAPERTEEAYAKNRRAEFRMWTP